MMDTQKVVFMNKQLNLRLAGLLRIPEPFDISKNYPAVVVTGPMLSVKEQAQSVYAERLTEAGYVTLVFDGSYFGESEGLPRGQELPDVKESDIEGAVDYLCSLPYVDSERIGGLGICGSGSYMSVAGVKEPRLKAITAVVPAIADISTSPMMGFFKPEAEVVAAKEAYDKGEGEMMYLNFMPRAFDEGAAYYYSSRGTHPRWSNQVVAWSQLELIKYNVPAIMKNMTKPYCVISGENAWSKPSSEDVIEAKYQAFVKAQGVPEEYIPADVRPLIRGMFSDKPYIEGAWMDKHDGKYYFQYAAPGTQYNTYSDGVYVGESPLGPFTLAANNPYSYKPGGFLPGAGHGSTMRDKNGAWWHTATMRISVNHDFERRVGLWPAGFDKDGELFCNQRYGDWPLSLEGDPWRDPAWMLLSMGKTATASSFVPGHEPEKATEENVQTWWRAASNSRDEWLCVDLGSVFDVHAVQVNFADDKIDLPCPGEIRPGSQARYIEEQDYATRWKLEGSTDGESWFVIEDKSDAVTDLSHDLIVREEGFLARYLRLSNMAVPYGQNPCISGLRVFGLGDGEKPETPTFTAARMDDLDMIVQIKEQPGALGYNILFGSAPEKLYHSDMVFSAGSHRIGALIKDREYFVRVDAFNENGITEGACIKLN